LTFALNPAFNQAKDLPGDLAENVALANVGLVVEELKQTGAHFPEMVKEGKLTIVPAYYDMDTGKVDLLGT
ncbi:MAG: carbonic anhydrase, partial [Candidatus Thioglobus sp.]|nr:carbonic anhydrase [Candidatus Thioglobus sp.]